MTTTDLATRVPALLPEAVEQALVQGNLAELSPAQRVVLYKELCSSLGLNPLSVPFQYITLNGRLVLYAVKNCTDQLRFIHNVNVEIMSRERIDDIYVVTTRATLPNGRTDEEIGAVPIAGIKGEALANALMKASTKAKRRVTLAIVGLSMLDETEVDSVRDARQPKFQVVVDPATKEINEQGDDIRERLMDGWATVWNQANALGLKVPDALAAGKMSNADLLEAGADLKARVLAEMDRRKAAPDPEPEPVPA
jgi:hypothetical protein